MIKENNIIKPTLKTQKKNSNNNNFEKVTTFQKRSQLTLSGQVAIKSGYKLCKNYKHLLAMFRFNSHVKWTRNKLMKNKGLKMHINTVSNFLKDAESRGFIQKLKKNKGEFINTLFFYHKCPDKFADGVDVPDRRATYYQITDLGIKVYDLNENVSFK